MPQGWVTTARGDALDLDGLIMKSKLPLVKEKQKHATVKPQEIPQGKAINVRGHMPPQGKHVMADMPKEVQEVVDEKRKALSKDQTLPKSSYNDAGLAETMAEQTGMKMKVTPEAIERAKKRIAGDQPVDALEASSDALNEIMTDLSESNAGVLKNSDMNPNDAVGEEDAAAKKPARRTRKSS